MFNNYECECAAKMSNLSLSDVFFQGLTAIKLTRSRPELGRRPRWGAYDTPQIPYSAGRRTPHTLPPRRSILRPPNKIAAGYACGGESADGLAVTDFHCAMMMPCVPTTCTPWVGKKTPLSCPYLHRILIDFKHPFADTHTDTHTSSNLQ